MPLQVSPSGAFRIDWNLGPGQESEQRSVEALGRDGEHPLDRWQGLRLLSAAKCRNERIAANRRLRLRIVLWRSLSRWFRKASTSDASRVGEGEALRRLSKMTLREPQQQAEAIAV